MKGNGVEMGG